MWCKNETIVRCEKQVPVVHATCHTCQWDMVQRHEFKTLQ